MKSFGLLRAKRSASRVRCGMRMGTRFTVETCANCCISSSRAQRWLPYSSPRSFFCSSRSPVQSYLVMATSAMAPKARKKNGIVRESR